MKTVRIVLVSVVFIFAMGGSDFVQGWNYGYESGYCHGKSNFCIAPMAPFAPFPNYGEDSWLAGYNRGFIRGMMNGRGQ